MANVVRLCGMTHSMMGTVLKTLNQAASETQRLCYRRSEDGDPQNSEKREHGAMGSASTVKTHWLHGNSGNTRHLCVVLRAQSQGCVHRLKAHLNLSSINALGFPGGLGGQESACNTGDWGSIPGLQRSSGEWNGYPLQYSSLENFMDRGAWWAPVHGVTKSRTQLNDSHFHFHS